MSDNLVIDPRQFPFPLHNKAIRSSSYRGTNISSSLRSASLIPDYSIPIPKYRISFFSRIRSSKNSANFYSKLSKTPSVLLEDAGHSSQRGVTCRYPKQSPFDWIGGRVAKYSKSAKYPKGKPQLNGFVSDSQVLFDPDSFRVCAAVNEAKLMLQHQGLTPPLNPASMRKIDKQTIFIGFGGEGLSGK
jgi:hypothetical protein